MFCPKCGAKMPEGARFCSKCGATISVAPASAAVQAPVAPPKSTSSLSAADKGKLFAVGNAVLALAAFLPWLSINVYVFSGQFSLLDASTTALRLLGQIESLVGSYAYNQYSGWILLAIIAFIAMTVAMVAGNAADAVSGFRGKGGSRVGAAISLCCAILIIVAAFIVGSMLRDMGGNYLGSSAAAVLSGLVSTTMWPWAVAIGSGVLIWFRSRSRK